MIMSFRHKDYATCSFTTTPGNWRLTFEFINGNAHLLNYEDYH